MNNLFKIVTMLILLLPFHIAKAENILNVALLGDSMTWIGGENFEKPNGWTYYLADLPLNMKTYARSGATWTNTSETFGDINAYSAVIDPENVIYTQVLRLLGDDFKPDVVIIYAGTNDAWFESKRPGLFGEFEWPDHAIDLSANPADFTTLEGSVQLAGSILNQHLPEARLYLVTPAHSGKTAEEKIEKVSDIIEKTGLDVGARVVRGDKEFEFRHEDEKSKPYWNTYDGVHTNPQGARRIAECIRHKILEPEIATLRNK